MVRKDNHSMLTQIQCLEEIVTCIPNSKRRFHIVNELMGIDLDKSIGARTFDGVVLVAKSGQDYESETDYKMVEVFYPGGTTITTIFDNDINRLLFGFGRNDDIVEVKEAKQSKGPETMPKYNEPNKLEFKRNRDINSWN